MDSESASGKLRSRRFTSAVLFALLCALAVGAPAASAALPTVGTPWATDVTAASAQLHARINPNGGATTYHFSYITEAAYEANISAGKDGFAGSLRSPKAEAPIGAGATPVEVFRTLLGLAPETTYLYRVVATQSADVVTSFDQIFITQALGGGETLPDNRGWELVSPIDKNGGQVDPPGAILGGGSQQAAIQGGAVTYGSAASFAGGTGAPPASQYLATRTPSGWSTQNLTVPLFAGSFGTEPEGVPYRLFSADLARGLLLNGQHCRGEATACPVANPPLPGTGAPAGYQDLYLREGASFASVLGAADVANSPLQPRGLELSLAGSSPDLRHLVLSSCAALTANATEAPLGEGCDPAKQNLYLWSAGTGLTLVNSLPGATLAAPAGAVSADGSRVYWSDGANLYLREGATTKQADAAAGGGGAFQAASADGSVAYFTKGGHLWRYQAVANTATDLTPGGGVKGVLGVSADGGSLCYLSAAGLFLRQGSETTKVADTADASNYPPATGTARVSLDGTKLLFISTFPLIGYDNTDANTGLPDSEVYLYDADSQRLECVSCNPTNARPDGPSSIPAAVANGQGPGKTQAYKPRALSADGNRVFFDSDDALAAVDTNNDSDVYQWEAVGTGNCAKPGGCISLISSGRAEGGASFLDASADGADAFFLTDGSLVKADPGSVDVYDARVGGGFPEPEEEIPCEGNACQGLLSEPTDPALNTTLAGLGNPKVRYLGEGKPCKKGEAKRKGRCVKKSKKKKRHGKGGQR
jgi:hypothetical protein